MNPLPNLPPRGKEFILNLPTLRDEKGGKIIRFKKEVKQWRGI
jgi:hypothetical protein